MPDDMPEGYPFKLPTPASTVIARFGFSQKEAAAFYGVRLDTIKKWISGKMEMPDDLLLESYVKLDALSHLMDFIADKYCDQAADNETCEHMAGQYISLPTIRQMMHGFMPQSKGFFDIFFGGIAAKCYAAGQDRFCYITPCEPDEDLSDTNLWLIPWFESGLVMDMCIEREDEIIRFDVSLYDYLRSELKSWKNVVVRMPKPEGDDPTWDLDEIGLELPYVPDWYAEAHDLNEEQMTLVDTTVSISLNATGAEDFSDLGAFQSRAIHFVEDNEIRVMMEAFESPRDADLTATNENLAIVLRDVFGTRSAFLKHINYTQS